MVDAAFLFKQPLKKFSFESNVHSEKRIKIRTFPLKEKIGENPLLIQTKNIVEEKYCSNYKDS